MRPRSIFEKAVSDNCDAWDGCRRACHCPDASLSEVLPWFFSPRLHDDQSATVVRALRFRHDPVFWTWVKKRYRRKNTWWRWLRFFNGQAWGFTEGPCLKCSAFAASWKKPAYEGVENAAVFWLSSGGGSWPIFRFAFLLTVFHPLGKAKTH